MSDKEFRDLLAAAVAKARDGGLDDDTISLALAGALFLVRAGAYRA